jgi:phosphoglycolate phosphatase
MIKHVIWDWNGTIIDDAQLCVSIVNEILSSNKLSKVNLSYYRDHFCFPVTTYYKKIGLPDDERNNQLISESFIRQYRLHWKSCSLHTHAREVLTALHDAGIRQSLLSAAKTTDLKDFVDHFGLGQVFDFISGVSDIKASGKMTVSLNHFASVNLPPEQVILVGDTGHDAEIAAYLKIQTALYTCGHNSEQVLKRAGRELIGDLRLVLQRVLG